MAENKGGDPIKDFYNAVIAPEKHFKSEAEFRSVVMDPVKGKEFYDIVLAPENHFSSYDAFASTLGLKKKDLRSEATSLASGSALETAETSALPSVSPSSSQSNQLAKNQRILDDAIGGLTPSGNIPKPGEKTIADISQVPASELSLPKKIQTTSDGQDLVDSFARGSSNLGKMLAETPAFIYDLAAYPQNKIAELTGLPISASSDQFAATVGLPDNEVAAYYDNAVKSSQEKINAKYDKPVSEYFSNGEFDKGFKLLSNQIMESAPISISLAMGNAGGLTPAQSIFGGGAVFGAGKKAELDETNPNMNETDKINNAISTGLFEGMFEQFGITKLGGAVKNILAKEGKDIAKDLAEKGFKETYGPIFKKYLGVSFEESLSEAATQFSQNVVDKYSGAKPGLDLRDGLVDAAIIGFGAGSTFSSVPTALEVVKTKKGLSEAARINQEKATLQQDLESPNIADAAKQTISNRLGELNQEEANLAVEEKTKYAALPTELKSEVDALVKKSSEIQQSLDDTNLSEGGKKLLEKELESNEKRVDEIYSQAEETVAPETEIIEATGSEEVGKPPTVSDLEAAATAKTDPISVIQENAVTEPVEIAEVSEQITEPKEGDATTQETTTSGIASQPNMPDEPVAATDQQVPTVTETQTTFESSLPRDQFMPRIEQRAKELGIELPDGQTDAIYESVQEKIASSPKAVISDMVDETISEYKAPEPLPTKQESIAAISAKIDMPDSDFMPDLKQLANTYKAEGLDNPVDFTEAVRAEIPNLPTSVSDKVLNEAFLGSDVPLSESKTRKTFDAATKGISKEVQEGVTTKYKPRTIEESADRANSLWSAIETDTPDADEAVNEAEYHIENGTTGLDRVDLPVFATTVATKLNDLRNGAGKTMEQIQDYDRRAIKMFNRVRSELTEGGQQTSIGGKFLKEALMAYPSGIVSMVQNEIATVNEAKFGKLPDATTKEISDLLNELTQTEQGKEAVAQFIETYTGAKRKASIKKKYAKKKDIWNDLMDDFIEANAPKDPRKGGTLNSAVPAAVLLRPSLIAIKKAVSLGLTVAEAVEVGMVELRKQYRKAFDEGELASPDFDESATKSWLEGAMNNLQKEADRIENMTPEQKERLAKEREAAKQVKIQEQISAKLQAEADAKKQKALEAAARFDEAKSAREKAEAEMERETEEERVAKSDAKERAARRKADFLEALNKARRAEMQADLAKRRAQRDLENFQKKLDKLKGRELAKFTYDLLSNVGIGKVTEEMVNDAFYKLQGGTTLSQKQLEKIKSLAISVTEINKEIPSVWGGKSDAKQNADFKRKVFKAQRVREQIMHEMKRPGFIDLFQFAMTGNLMTLKSILGGGTVGNAVQNAVSWPRDFVAGGFDYLLAKLPGMAQGKKNFFPSKEAIKAKGLGFIVGGEAGLREMKDGPTDDNTEWSDQYNAKPWEAIKRIAEDWNDNTPKLTKAYRISLDIAEGTTFFPAFVFRSLNLSDKIFRTSSTMAAEQVIADELGIPISEFLTAEEYKDYREVAKELGAKDTFQGKDIIQRLFGGTRIGNAVDNILLSTVGKAISVFLVKPILPFKKTPLNVAEEVVKYAYWQVSFVSFLGNMAAASKEKNPAKKLMYRKLAARDASILTLSITTSLLIRGAIEAGMIGFTGGDDEEKNKPDVRKNRLTFEGMPKRMVVNWATGKKTYNISAMGAVGSAWALMYQNYVNETEEDRNVLEQLAGAGWDVMQVLREQTFLANVNQALKATEDEDRFLLWMGKTFGVNYTRALFPAINNQITEMTDSQEAVRLTKDENLMKELYNLAVRKNLGFISNISEKAGTGKIDAISYKELPVLYNLWGEPIKTKDEGETDVFNYLFDFTQGEDYKLEKVPQKQLFLKYAQTKNPAWLLPVADKKFKLSKGENFRFEAELTPQQQNEYQRILGEDMKRYVQMMKPSDLESLEKFEKAKKLATQSAKEKFYLENKDKFQKKEGETKKPFVPAIMK